MVRRTSGRWKPRSDVEESMDKAVLAKINESETESAELDWKSLKLISIDYEHK